MDIGKMIVALGDPMRFAVFECVRGCGGASAYDTETGLCDAGENHAVASCEVKCRVPCAPNTVSHHLGVLREAGLVATEKRGREVYVRVLPEALTALSDYFSAPTSPRSCQS